MEGAVRVAVAEEVGWAGLERQAVGGRAVERSEVDLENWANRHTRRSRLFHSIVFLEVAERAAEAAGERVARVAVAMEVEEAKVRAEATASARAEEEIQCVASNSSFLGILDHFAFPLRFLAPSWTRAKTDTAQSVESGDPRHDTHGERRMGVPTRHFRQTRARGGTTLLHALRNRFPRIRRNYGHMGSWEGWEWAGGGAAAEAAAAAAEAVDLSAGLVAAAAPAAGRMCTGGNYCTDNRRSAALRSRHTAFRSRNSLECSNT